jgi:Ca-activated chloride channel homolog
MRTRWLPWLVASAVLFVLCAWIYFGKVVGASQQDFELTYHAVKYELLEPRRLAALLVLPVVVFVASLSLADLPWFQRVLSAVLRIAFLALLAVSLSEPVRTGHTDHVANVILVDVSDSVPDEALEKAQKAAQALVRAARPGDLVRLVAFAERPRLVPLADSKDGLSVPSLIELRRRADEKASLAGTNLQAALELGYGLFPPGYLKRAVIFSDGVETNGDVLAAASRARELGVRVSVAPYDAKPPPEVAVTGLRLPEKVDVGQSFDVVGELYATRAESVRVRLYQGETLNGLDSVRELSLKPGRNELKFQSVVRVGGAVTYSLVADSVGQDSFASNNRFSATLDVAGRPQVLYVEGQPARATYLTSALSAQQYDVDVRSPAGFPGSLQELERYDFVIISDVPHEQVSLASQELLERYVRDVGGGFLFAGGEAGYSLGGWAHTTVERILPVRMDAERLKETPGVALVLVIDRSGSMTGLPIEMAKVACQAAVSTLDSNDIVEVIGFDSTPIRAVKMGPARYRTRIQNEIARITPGGGTEIFSALDAAYQDISVVQARRKHVILLTDGNAPTQGIRDLVQAMLAESITVTSVGLGDATNPDLLRMIAETGGGRFHSAPDPNSLPKIFTRETELVSREAAVEDWFPVVTHTPADFLKGIAMGSAPLLHGYVTTQMKAPPAQLILATESGEPILARMRVGLGWTLAWTSDVKNAWAADWLRWPSFSKFWGQLVREHMKTKDHRELPMRTELVDGRLHARVDAFTPDERFENGMSSRLTVTGPEPGGERLELPMRQTAPGRYEVDAELPRFGSFRIHAEHQAASASGELRTVSQSFGHVSNPYPREYASFEPDRARLERIALVTAGFVEPAPSKLFDPEGAKIDFHEPLWNRLVIAALGLFLVDLFLRRVRLFDRKRVERRPAR